MRIALTGAAGYLGRHLRKALTEEGHTVIGTDRNGPAAESTFDLINGGLFKLWLANHSPDVVVHMAARTGRLFGEDDKRDAVRSNAEATVNVASVCGELGIRLVYASSSEIYGDNGGGFAFTEDGGWLPSHNLYGLSKRWGEEACQLYAPDKLTVWRISMPYGPGAKVGYRGLNALHAFLYAAHNRQPITVHKGASRSWTWVGDTMAGMLATLDMPGVWNIGGDHDHRPMTEVAHMACEIAGAPTGLVTEIDPPSAQTLVKRIDSGKLERETGWRPTMPLEVGMVATYDWVRQHDADGRRLGVWTDYGADPVELTARWFREAPR